MEAYANSWLALADVEKVLKLFGANGQYIEAIEDRRLQPQGISNIPAGGKLNPRFHGFGSLIIKKTFCRRHGVFSRLFAHVIRCAGV